ncbi:MAG: ABC transporter permease, partial [Myxococcota bacterium]
MGPYLIARLLRALGTIAGVVTLVFAMVRLTPGDPVDALLGEQAAEADRARMRERLHLDESLPSQYVRFLGDVADGSLGRSFRSGEVVASSIAEVLPDTALLALSALLVAWVTALFLGVLAARYRGRAPDRAASTLAVAGLAIPNIWLGPLLILLFGVQLRWLPLPGDEQAGIASLVLPALTLGTALAATLTRQIRGSLSEALRA